MTILKPSSFDGAIATPPIGIDSIWILCYSVGDTHDLIVLIHSWVIIAFWLDDALEIFLRNKNIHWYQIDREVW